MLARRDFADKKNWFWALLFAAAALRFCFMAIYQSGDVDLHVYWKAAHQWLSGISPYLYQGSEGAVVFKYPPWTLPIFLPLGFIEFDALKWVWALLQLFATCSIVRWIIRAGANTNVALFSIALFWWIWLGHAMAGQFTIFILLAALWAVPPEENSELSPVKISFMSLLISAKIFHAFSLIGVFRTLIRPKTVLITASLFLLLNLFVMLVFRAHGNGVSIVELYRSWMDAGASGGAIFSAETIRGQGNHSFTAALLRWFHVPASDSSKDIGVATILGCTLSAIWYRLSTHLPRADRWAGWLAVGTVIHPLLWHHSFVLAYPVCALALDRAIRSRNLALISAAAVSHILVALLIPNIFGLTIVTPFELLASKSWGITLACATLLLSYRRIPQIAGTEVYETACPQS